MAEILTQAGLLVTEAIGWLTEFVTVIVAQPLLLLFVVTSFVGLGIGLIRRIIHMN